MLLDIGESLEVGAGSSVPPVPTLCSSLPPFLLVCTERLIRTLPLASPQVDSEKCWDLVARGRGGSEKSHGRSGMWAEVPCRRGC